MIYCTFMLLLDQTQKINKNCSFNIIKTSQKNT